MSPCSMSEGILDWYTCSCTSTSCAISFCRKSMKFVAAKIRSFRMNMHERRDCTTSAVLSLGPEEEGAASLYGEGLPP